MPTSPARLPGNKPDAVRRTRLKWTNCLLTVRISGACPGLYQNRGLRINTLFLQHWLVPNRLAGLYICVYGGLVPNRWYHHHHHHYQTSSNYTSRWKQHAMLEGIIQEQATSGSIDCEFVFRTVAGKVLQSNGDGA